MTPVDAVEALMVGDAWSPALLADLDERDAFPAGAVDSLDAAGLQAHYVLTPDSDFHEMVSLVRAVARRDLTVAIAHGKTFLGSAAVWVAGTPAQCDRLADRVRAGEPVCLALTERNHGADLLAGELAATALDTGWRLDGEKWLINNAARAGLACVLARTDPAGGGRGFSFFLVDRRRLHSTAWETLPKVRTHGIRGADISGFVLHGAEVGEDALVGAVGDGLTVALKALQLTRIACVALSLGAADHALRLARDFVTTRELYGRALAEVPHVRRILGRAAARALAAEAVSTVAARSVRALPGELSVTSAIAKAFVPAVVGELLSELAELLGARGFLTSPPGVGFAKLERDHRVCGIFDGSTVVNRVALAGQLPRLGRLLGKGLSAPGLAAAVDLGTETPPFDRSRLALVSATGSSLVQALPAAVKRLPAAIAPLADALTARLAALEAELAGFVPVAGGLPSSAFDLAERYERTYAAAACVLLWQANHHRDHTWLRACLAVLLDEPDDAAFEAMAQVLLTWSGQAFSLPGAGA
ncbi:acyl-CoA dehydrogenase [Actinokineospora sp. NBRC 105648]|uniref:acyl-CoA dehydrogenase n=1 Tax=Actinokineospora sp. NBRC 105648 TaxID=3032206 RepID=UPI00249FFB96|nr:acyl-CoA dehydrogenase [Actinokineospora sp. NBRC 105648]GLZ41078.1 acyl-CoA dehydrogenase [Actinokineospora sp. NBRC 105648]